MNVSGGILESACLSIRPCSCVSVCMSVYKILISVKALAGYQVTISDSSSSFQAFELLLFKKGV